MSGKQFLQFSDFTTDLKPLKAKDMIEKEFVVVGSPATVRDKLEAMAKRLNVGHLMVALQFGSMPHDAGQEEHRAVRARSAAAPAKIWEDKALGEPWWPKKLRNRAVKKREMATA